MDVTNRPRSREDVPYRELADWARDVMDGSIRRRAEEARQRQDIRRERKAS